MRLLLVACVLVLAVAGYLLLRRKAATSSSPSLDNEAQRLYEEAMAYRKGLDVELDRVRARQLFLAAAEKGSIAAQFELGVMMRHGLGGPHDPEAALKWIELAARSGDPQAALDMGKHSLSGGDGAEKNEENAFFWFCEAAQLGNAEAQFLLAQIYRDKHSSHWNSSKAASLMLEAAEQRFPAALFAISEMYEAGEGVTRDIKAADQWLTAAAERGVPEAQFKLGKYYLSGAFGHAFPQDFRKALEWFRRAGAHGVAEAEYEAGLRYERNEGVDMPDKIVAVEHFLKAAEMGFAPAQYRMGQLYQYGDTVAKNLDEARRWFKAAAAQGYGEAADREKALLQRDSETPFIAPASEGAAKADDEDWKG